MNIEEVIAQLRLAQETVKDESKPYAYRVGFMERVIEEALKKLEGRPA